ncbi:MAG: hypothetical protein ABI887_16940, partial [Burkholderiales bacterium]
DQRREIVQGLWADDAENISRRFVIRGMDEILQRVNRSHLEWVQTKGFRFRAVGVADSHNHLIMFPWEMAPRDGGPAEANGMDVFVLNDDGRIQSLYHFAAPTPVAPTA